jgi:DNA-binding transcriptional MerR regulator
MDALVSIGDFSKMTYLSVKALRHYHDVGLLEPAYIDPATGYRRYATSQVPVAHAIRRFRDLDMPLDEIRVVLRAPDTTTGTRAILRHLARMQSQLEQTQQTVASLQAVLGAQVDANGQVEIRHLPRVTTIAEASDVSFEGCAGWLEEALARLRARAGEEGLVVSGPDGALYDDAFFSAGCGKVTAFIPVAEARGATTLPGSTVALLVHSGPFDDLDRTYGALGTIVAERGIGGRGPIREHYLDGDRTEVCWPVADAAEDPLLTPR